MATVQEGQTFAGESLLARYSSFVKLPHTFFALPFAGVGALLATYAEPRGLGLAEAFWILVAFTAARFAAMGFNRMVDRELDAANPRTARRELPEGRLTTTQATLAVALAGIVFILAAARLNPLVGWLAPVALAWVFFYSFTKRFTSWSHVVLGLALGIAPVGAYLAVTGAWSAPWYALPLLAAAVTCWVAGFDVIYATQDADFDRRQGLHSIPARFGVGRGLGIARGLHGAAVVLFGAVWAVGGFGLGWLYLAGVGVMAVLLHLEHAALGRARRGAAEPALDAVRVDRAFFRVNVAVSLTLFAATLLDRVLLG
jgi:4-hydroxybenzoate polyprenyltransferase